jgi:hypothetical protein
MRTTTRLSILAAVTAALLAVAVDARAGEAPPDPLDEVPALGEYVEDIPTASGRKPSAKPAEPEKKPSGNKTSEPSQPAAPAEEPETRSLPQEVEKEIEKEGGSLAKKLRKIATTSRYGAEKRPARHERDRVQRALREPDAKRAPAAQALGTAVTAGFGGGNTHMSVLLVALLVTTAGAAAAAGYRNRPGGR